VLARLSPARAAVPQDYLAALAQRNAALRRVQLGLSDRAAARVWTDRVASLGAVLVGAADDARAARSRRLPRVPTSLAWPARVSTTTARSRLPARLELACSRDVDAVTTGLGPHLDDVLIASASATSAGSARKGEQRLAVLSLLLAEAELLPAPPLLLLDTSSPSSTTVAKVLRRRVAGKGRR